MSLPDAWGEAIAEAGPELPERDLLREPDRLRSYTEAFLRGEIDQSRYNQLTLDELSRRVPMVPDVPTVRSRAAGTMRAVQPVIFPQRTENALPPAPAPVRREPGTPASRTHAERYVRGEISGDEFLRLVRAEA